MTDTKVGPPEADNAPEETENPNKVFTEKIRRTLRADAGVAKQIVNWSDRDVELTSELDVMSKELVGAEVSFTGYLTHRVNDEGDTEEFENPPVVGGSMEVEGVGLVEDSSKYGPGKKVRIRGFVNGEDRAVVVEHFHAITLKPPEQTS